MERLGKIILNGAGYTVLYLAIYYALGGMFGTSGGTNEIKVGIGRFFLTLLFGLVISMTNFLFGGSNLRPWLKRILAYLVSAVAFFFIIILGYDLMTNGAGMFIGIVLFTVFYFACVGVAYLVKRTLYGDEKKPTASKPQKQQKKSKYQPLYKD